MFWQNKMNWIFEWLSLSPANKLSENDVKIWIFDLGLLENSFDHAILVTRFFKVLSSLILVLELRSEPVGCDIVVLLLLLLGNVNWWLIHGFSHLFGKQLVVILLIHLLFLSLDVLVLLDISINFFKLLQSLFDWLIKLHGVLCGMLQSLLKISNLSG